jgi:hypothetical protein
VADGKPISPLALYDLVERLRQIMGAVDDAEGEVCVELDLQLESLGVAFERKVEVYSGLITLLEAEASGCASLAERYQKRKESKLRLREQLRERLAGAMTALGQRKVATATATVYFQKSPPRMVLRANEIEVMAAGYKQTVESVDKQRLRADVEAGNETALQLAALEQGETLRIRS